MLLEKLPEVVEHLAPRKGPVDLDRLQDIEALLDLRYQLLLRLFPLFLRFGETQGVMLQLAPGVRAELRSVVILGQRTAGDGAFGFSLAHVPVLS